jgi:hypothetical protein
MANEEIQPVGLAEAIDNLRQEMTKAIEHGKGQDLRFNVEQAELELGVDLHRDIGVDGKVSFKILGSGLEMGGEGGRSRATANRLKITLKPCGPDGPIQVSDEDIGRPK